MKLSKFALNYRNMKEEIRNLLLAEMSRRNTDLVADLVGKRPEVFDELFRLYLGGGDPVDRRAAWVIDLVTESQPGFLEGRQEEIIRHLPLFRHDGLKRHSLRMLSRLPLPSGEEAAGVLMQTCFDWLLSPAEAVAAKVYCMDILVRFAEIEPDLRREVSDTIEWRIGEETPGFRTHAAKLLKKLRSSPGSPRPAGLSDPAISR
ncbi:MAG TPA: hypothetical protein PLK82_09615 [Bacteroidales bacterium]|nr:hypothetical protein [Bacteroidales bacterium]